MGGGLGGALVARAPSRAGRSAIVIDGRGMVQGSTPASTGMIQQEIEVLLSGHIRRLGRPRTEAARRHSAVAVERAAALVRRLRIDTGMERRRRLFLVANESGARGLAEEAEARRASRLAAEFLNAPALRLRFGIARTGAILSDASASANPAQRAAGLLPCAQRTAAARRSSPPSRSPTSRFPPAAGG